jgi:acetylglutamate kinase
MQITVTTHYARTYSKPRYKEGSRVRNKETARLVLEDLAKAKELKAALKQYTLKAIANRRGIHRRTVQKLAERAKRVARPKA